MADKPPVFIDMLEECPDPCGFRAAPSSQRCVCGHQLGEHVHGHPHPCDHVSLGAFTCDDGDTVCAGFRKW